ncbi:hypothetical protein HPP92_024240 [Vanilla planifolia]|uniref:OPA3-like protein n=1 Tax=Vanilla planifolia TaxID=51239 RepID=A0A835PRU0_VANPL|nr:hypothetical protein HPP92_024240 [Vanilla planifolia]
MILPFVKLGTLALRTLAKPIASKLKQAGVHPRFRELIVNLAQVAGGAIVFEVQRSSRSEAKKEELRRQELEALRRKGEDMAKEVDLLKQKLIQQAYLGREFK